MHQANTDQFAVISRQSLNSIHVDVLFANILFRQRCEE